MYSPTRRTALAVLLVAALVAMLGAQAIKLDGSQTIISGTDLTSAVLEFVDLSSQSSVAITITGTTVGAAGVTFQGMPTSGVTTDAALTVLVSGMTVDAGTITCTQHLPRNTYISFSQVVGTNLAGPLFTFDQLNLDYNTTMLISAPSSSWASPSGASLIRAQNGFDIRTQSALFVESPTSSQAIASIYSDINGPTTVAVDSIFAIDSPRCTLCTGALVDHSSEVSISSRSLYRITDAQAGPGGIISGSSSIQGNSVMEIEGSIPSTTGTYLPGFDPTISSDSRLVLGPLTGGGTLGLNNPLNDGVIYGYGTSVAGGQTLGTEQAWNTAGATGTVIVVDGNGQSAGQCVNTICLSGTSMGQAGTVCTCQCTANLFSPYCTPMYDPIGLSGGCPATLPNCIEIDPNTCLCSRCNPGFTPINGVCYPDATPGPSGCTVANCKTCCSDLVRCCECIDGYVLEPVSNMECRPCAERLPGCTQCLDWNTCGSCSATYQVVGNTCVRRASSSNGSVMVPTLVGSLLLVVSSLAVYLG